MSVLQVVVFLAGGVEAFIGILWLARRMGKDDKIDYGQGAGGFPGVLFDDEFF